MVAGSLGAASPQKLTVYFHSDFRRKGREESGPLETPPPVSTPAIALKSATDSDFFFRKKGIIQRKQIINIRIPNVYKHCALIYSI